VDAAHYERELAAYTAAVKAALLAEYREIFQLTALVCLAGALTAAFLGRVPTARRGH
jgi:predicted pyridoxine 5'-phosphate oxidase superfamily flavin-nucleotide-binding protein